MAHGAELPLLAGLSMQAWDEGYGQVGTALGIGQLTKAEGFERILRDGGVEPRPDLVRALVDRDRELLLRSRGCTTTLWSSCGTSGAVESRSRS